MSSSDSSVETPSSPESEGAAESSDGAARFAASLAEQVGDDDGESRDDGNKDGGEGKPVDVPGDLNALAQRLGVDVAKLYDVKIPAPGGREAMTLGQIKDRYTAWSALETDRLASEERIRVQESELEIARQEFRELLNVIPREALNKEALTRAAEALAGKRSVAQQRMTATFPEWSDAERRKADMAEMGKTLAGYGLSTRYLESVTDPGLMRFIRDAVRREAQVRKALESVRVEPRKKQASTGPARRAAPAAPANQGNGNRQRPMSERERFLARLNSNS